MIPNVTIVSEGHESKLFINVLRSRIDREPLLARECHVIEVFGRTVCPAFVH